MTKGLARSCAHCLEANAPHLPHGGTGYKPTRPGRLVHADLAGPFRRSLLGSYQYLLLVTDDHSRYKHVYFLRKKSEAPALMRRYLASFNALLS